MAYSERRTASVRSGTQQMPDDPVHLGRLQKPSAGRDAWLARRGQQQSCWHMWITGMTFIGGPTTQPAGV